MNTASKKLQTYELSGFANLSGTIPSFVFPVFKGKKDNKLYFQKNSEKKLSIKSFIPIEMESLNCILPLANVQTNDYSIEKDFGLNSDPLFAFQTSEDFIYYGNCSEIKSFLRKFNTDEDFMLKEEISEFIKYLN